jgi:hypothetical protein
MPDISEVTSPPSPPFLAPFSSKQEVKEVKEKGGSLETVSDFLRSWFAPLFVGEKKILMAIFRIEFSRLKRQKRFPAQQSLALNIPATS